MKVEMKTMAIFLHFYINNYLENNACDKVIHIRINVLKNIFGIYGYIFLNNYDIIYKSTVVKVFMQEYKGNTTNCRSYT